MTSRPQWLVSYYLPGIGLLMATEKTPENDNERDSTLSKGFQHLKKKELKNAIESFRRAVIAETDVLEREISESDLPHFSVGEVSEDLKTELKREAEQKIKIKKEVQSKPESVKTDQPASKKNNSAPKSEKEPQAVKEKAMIQKTEDEEEPEEAIISNSLTRWILTRIETGLSPIAANTEISGVGIVDLWASDTEGNDCLIIFNQRETTTADIGKLLSMIGWVEREGTYSKPIRGIVLSSHDYSPSVKLAADASNRIALYRVDISVEKDDLSIKGEE